MIAFPESRILRQIRENRAGFPSTTPGGATGEGFLQRGAAVTPEVTHIQGETGCGKSTRLPQFILEVGNQGLFLSLSYYYHISARRWQIHFFTLGMSEQISTPFVVLQFLTSMGHVFVVLPQDAQERGEEIRMVVTQPRRMAAVTFGLLVLVEKIKQILPSMLVNGRIKSENPIIQ